MILIFFVIKKKVQMKIFKVLWIAERRNILLWQMDQYEEI